MNGIKKVLGYVWMLLSIALVGLMASQAWNKVSHAAQGIVKTNTLLQWIIILLVFIPICVGLFIFGKYSSQGEYTLLQNETSPID